MSNSPIKSRMAVRRRLKRLTPMQVAVQSVVGFFTHPLTKMVLGAAFFALLAWLTVCALILGFG